MSVDDLGEAAGRRAVPPRKLWRTSPTRILSAIGGFLSTFGVVLTPVSSSLQRHNFDSNRNSRSRSYFA